MIPFREIRFSANNQLMGIRDNGEAVLISADSISLHHPTYKFIVTLCIAGDEIEIIGDPFGRAPAYISRDKTDEFVVGTGFRSDASEFVANSLEERIHFLLAGYIRQDAIGGLSFFPSGVLAISSSGGEPRLKYNSGTYRLSESTPWKLRDLLVRSTSDLLSMQGSPERVAVSLSGGLDSVTTAVLLRALGVEVSCYSAHFVQAPVPPDLVVARRVAAELGMDFHVVDVSISQYDDYLSQCGQLPLPCGDPNTPALLAIADAARRDGFRILWTGDGPDEILCGYPHYIRLARESKDRFSRYLGMADIDPDTVAVVSGLYRGDEDAPNPLTILPAVELSGYDTHRLQQMMRLDQEYWMGMGLMYKSLCVTLLTGVEVCSPFLTKGVLAFGSQCDISQLCREEANGGVVLKL